MKSVMLGLALLLAGNAAAFENCNRLQVAQSAHRLAQETRQLALTVRREFQYASLAIDADRLGEEARRLAESARGGLVCESLHRDFDRYVERAFAGLREGQRALQARFPNTLVRQAFRDVARAQRELHAQLSTGPIVTPPVLPPRPPVRPPVLPPRPPVLPPHPPVLPPRPPVLPPNACGLLAGTYVGTCRSNAGAVPLSFTVVNQGYSCLMTNGNLIAPALLTVQNGAGVASNFAGIGVAINNTQLVVYGRGQFRLTGYNYAGKLWFTCTP